MTTMQGNATPPPQRPGSSKSGRYVVIGFIIAILLLLLSGILPRLGRQKRIVAEASEVTAAPMVTVAPGHAAEV